MAQLDHLETWSFQSSETACSSDSCTREFAPTLETLANRHKTLHVSVQFQDLGFVFASLVTCFCAHVRDDRDVHVHVHASAHETGRVQ